MNDLASLPNTFPRQDQDGMRELARVLTAYLMPQYLQQPPVQDVPPGTVGKIPQNQIDPVGAGVSGLMDLASILTPAGIGKAAAIPAAKLVRGAYRNVPDNLMGFGRGPATAFNMQRYKYELPVRVHFDDDVFEDAVKGLNGPHALERAYRNWPNAKLIEGLDKALK